MTELEFFLGPVDYETLNDAYLLSCLEINTKESLEVATAESMNWIVESERRTVMTQSDARSRMEAIFSKYLTFFRRNFFS